MSNRASDSDCQLRSSSSKEGCLQAATIVVPDGVVTDLTVCIFPTNSPSSCELDMSGWYRIDKDLCQYQSQQSAYLYVARANEKDLAAEDLLLTDIRIGGPPPNPSSGYSWESRAAGIWVLRGKFCDTIGQAVTEVDVLFGTDAVDPRPQWTLIQSQLQLDHQPKPLVAKLSVLRGRAKLKPDTRQALRVREDGTFKIVQISDTHMVTGVGVCKDAIDAVGKDLPECDADPLTVSLIESVLDAEKPDLVILTGDQLHHDIPDSQSALFKVVAPIIKRSIPFAAVFGNHDSEGTHALSRKTQMSILENLPLSFCDSGPDDVDGVGNFCLEILASAPSQVPLLTLYFLDSHGQTSGSVHKPGYDSISQSQIKWFTDTSQAKRLARETGKNDNDFHLSLAFFHIPLPEFSDCRLRIHSGHRREPTEGPSVNTHLYDALVEERVSALGVGHDHVNDFCALLPAQTQQDGNTAPQHRPWLCHAGGSGFGGYGSYGGRRSHRGMRLWEVGMRTGRLKTWKRVEHVPNRVDELVLVEGGVVIDPDH